MLHKVIERGVVARALHDAQRVVQVGQHVKAAVLLHAHDLGKVIAQQGVAVQVVVVMVVEVEVVGHGVQRADDDVERIGREQRLGLGRVCVRLAQLDAEQEIHLPGKLRPGGADIARDGCEVAADGRRAAEQVIVVGDGQRVNARGRGGLSHAGDLGRLLVGVKGIFGVGVQVYHRSCPFPGLCIFSVSSIAKMDGDGNRGGRRKKSPWGQTPGAKNTVLAYFAAASLTRRSVSCAMTSSSLVGMTSTRTRA